MADVKKNDWFATLLFNPDLSIRELSEIGVTTDNSGLKSKDEYKNIDAVKEAFSDADGKFNDKKFNDFYNGALELYNQYALDAYDKKIPQLFIDSKWDAPREAPILNNTPTFDLKKTSAPDPNAVYYMPSPLDNKQYSPKELAEMEEVVDFETGESLGWTPEDKGGIFKGLVRPTIVLATWDEDGEHEENGRMVKHLAGDLKFNDNGKPYAETLGGREIRNKQVIEYSDTLTREKSNWNKVDFFDSDGYEKSFAGTLAKTAIKTIPYFIPGVNLWIGGIAATEQLLRVLPVLGKAINSIATGNSDNSFGQTMNQFEGWMSRFDPTTSYHSQENLVTFENFGNLISSISGQLFQQKAVGMLPYLLNGKKNTEGLANIGRNLSYAYMATTSAQDSYDVFKNAGASDRVAGFATVANMLAIWKLMQLDYFRDNLFKGTYMDESGIKVPAMNVATQAKDKLGTLVAEGEAVATKNGAAKFINKLSDFYYNTAVMSIAKGELPARMFSEATEEVMEEAAADLTKAVTSGLNYLGFNVTEEGKDLDFGITPEDILQRYGMAAAGGFIGGGIFAGQEKFEKWLLRRGTSITEPDDMKKFIYYIAQGKGQDMKDLYTKWHKRGLLGSKDLSTRLTTIESINGTKTVNEPVENNLSQNDVVYNHLINYIDYIEGLVNAEGIGFTKQQIDNLKVTGFDINDNTLKAQTLIDLGAYSTLEDDLWTLAADIVKKNNEIQEKIDALTPSGDTALSRETVDSRINNDRDIKRLKDELSELRKKREDILAGKLNYKYATQSLFITNPNLSDKFVDISKESFAKFKYGLSYNAMSDEQKTSVDSEFEEYRKGEGKERVIKAADLYYELATRWGGRIKEEADKLIGLKVDSFHKNKNLGLLQYAKLLNDVTAIEKEISALRSKESLTSEEQSDLNDKLQKLISLNSQVQAFQNAPGRLLALAQEEDSEFKELNAIFTSSDFGDAQIEQAMSLIKRLYEKAANDKVALSGDSELQALYNEIRNRYNTNSAETRMQSYFNAVAAAESQREIDDGVDENTYWEQIQNRVNTDTDEWFTSYPEETSNLKNDVLNYLKSFIDTFGTNNTVAMQAYNNILNVLRTRTHLTEDEISNFLNYVLPKVGNRNITDVMLEMDDVRSRVKYSPIASLLQDFWFDYSGTRSNIIDLLESEEKALASSPILTDYIIQNEQKKQDLKEAKSILDVISAILIGSVDKTNASINAFESNPKELPIIDRDAAVILGNDIDILNNRIQYLLDRDEINSQQALKQHERIDKNMRSKFLQAVTAEPFAEQFESIFKYKVGNIEKKINPKEILDEILPTNFSFDSIDLIDPNTLQDIWCKFEQRLYEEISKVSFYNNDSELGKAFLSLFSPKIWKMTSTKLSDKEDEIIQPADVLTYLMTIATIPSNAFYTTYKRATTSDNFKFAPVFGQEYSVRVATAMIARKGLFNHTLYQIMNNARSLFDNISNKKDAEYLKSLSKLYNFFMIPGGAGTGKSTGVAGTIAAMFSEYDSKQIVALAPKRKQAKNLADSLGATFLVKDDFMKSIRGGNEPEPYKQNLNTGHTTRTAPTSYPNTIFDKTKAIKILVVDEVGLFTESELKELSNWAKANDVFILGLGDPKQNTATVNAEVIDNGETITEKFESGLEDCVYFRSPMLTGSLRNGVLAKKNNFETLDSALYEIWLKYSDNREWKRSDLDKLVPKDIELKYFEGDGLFYGDKRIDDNTDLIAKARELKNSDPRCKVAIIYDNSGTTNYEGLTEEGIELLPFDEMQGDEYDYVLVDVDFTKHGIGAYATLKNLYTLTQRARLGSMVKKDNLEPTLSFAEVTSDPEQRQLIGVSEDQIKQFKEYRKKALDTVQENNSFYSYFKATTNSTVESANPIVETPVIESPQVNPEQLSPETSSEAVSSSVPASIGTSENPAPIPPTEPIQPVNPSGTPNPTPTGSNPKPSVPRPKIPNTQAKVANNGLMMVWLKDNNFRTYESQNPNSLFNFAKQFNSAVDFRTSGYPNLYTDLIETLGSIARTGVTGFSMTHPLAMELENALGYEDSSRIMDMLSQEPDLYIVPFNNDNNLLVARYNKDGNTIEIPVLFVDTKQTGKYTGKIKRLTELRLGSKGDMIPMSVFVANNPGVRVFNTAGVVSYKDESRSSIQNDDSLKDGSKKFLLAANKNGKPNNGKVMVAMTDELAEQFEFGDNIWIHPDDGNLLSYYNLICLMGIHKPLSISNIAAYVKAIQQGKSGEPLSGESLMQQGIWEDPTNPVEALKSLNWASLPDPSSNSFFSEIYKRKWQVVPTNRCQLLSRILLETALNDNRFEGVLWDLTTFLNTIIEPSKNIKSEEHVLILTGKNGKSVYITPSIQGQTIVGYNVYNYDPRTRYIDTDSLQKVDVSGIIPFTDWVNRLVGSQLESVQLMRAVTRQNNARELVDITANDQLFLLLDTLSHNPELLTQLDTELSKNQEFENRVYMDDSADDYINGSKYFKRFNGNPMNGYVTPVQTVQYSTYEIDESQIEVSQQDNVSNPEPTVDEKIKFAQNLIEQLNSLAGYKLPIGSAQLNMISEYALNHTISEVEDWILASYNRAISRRSKWNVQQIAKNDFGDYQMIVGRDVIGWINRCFQHNGSTQLLEDFLHNSWKCAIFSVTLPDGTSEIKIIDENGAIKDFNSYPTFKNILNLYNSNKDFYKPISKYIKGLLSGKGFSSKANNWLVSTEEAKEMYMLINEHLMDRLNKNEC